MKATSFEFRHQTLLHLLIVGLGVLTYAFYPDDVVWALVRRHADNRALERLVFGAGAIVVAGVAAFETWVTARDQALEPGEFMSAFPGRHACFQKMLRLARFLFALGLGLLLPLPGTVILIGGEAFLILRLLLRDRESVSMYNSGGTQHAKFNAVAPARAERSWRRGFRVSAAKWGIAASLILLSATLQDRVAEVTAGVGFLAWLAMNAHRAPKSG